VRTPPVLQHGLADLLVPCVSEGYPTRKQSTQYAGEGDKIPEKPGRTDAPSNKPGSADGQGNRQAG